MASIFGFGGGEQKAETDNDAEGQASPKSNGDAADGIAGDDAGSGEARDANKEESAKKDGLLGRLNPFGEKKEKADPKERERRKTLADQQRKEEAQLKARKKEREATKKEREETEESKRMLEKVERKQKLLQKNPDDTRRVFQFRMKAIKLESLHTDGAVSGLFLRVTLGGDYQEREEPGKGLVRKGTRGRQFTTATQTKPLHAGEAHYFRNEFGAGIPVYWTGSYVDLEMQELEIQLHETRGSSALRKARRRSTHRLSLMSLATGSVVQDCVLRDQSRPGDVAAAPYMRLQYACYFEELFIFRLQFVNWKGLGLHAADAPKKRARAEVDEARAAKRRARQDAKAKERKERKLRAKEKRAKRLKERTEEHRRKLAGERYQGSRMARSGGGAGPELEMSAAGDGGAESVTAPMLDVETTSSPRRDGSGADESVGSASRRGWLPWRAGRRRSSEGGSSGRGGWWGWRRSKLKANARQQKLKEMEEKRKEARRAAEDERLRALKEKKELKDKRRLQKLERGRPDYERSADEYLEATSDPYIVFSIDPPASPGCKLLRAGGYFGRSVRTDMVTNTLNPEFDEARKPLAYLGTRSELENEMLRIRVYDWDFFSADDLIGQADVPLHGLLEYGTVEVELTLDRYDRTKPKVRGKYPKVTEPAGRLSGLIQFEGKTPEFSQLGMLIERKPGITYLAVKLHGASKLRPADANGLADPFVAVDWDGAQQTSKVVQRELEPEWNETLYFPIKLVTLSKETLSKKPPVSIRVFDQDEAGHDLLGSCEIPLHRITEAAHAKVEGEETNGKVHKGRVLSLPAQRLELPAHTIASTIDLELYFVPDLPLDIVLDRKLDSTKTEMKPEYVAHFDEFYRELPARIQDALEAAIKADLGKEGTDFEPRKEDRMRIISAEDQDAVVHFFPEYLAKVPPPKELRDAADAPMQVARLVRCITWEEDRTSFKKEHTAGSQSCDVWQSPPFFLAMKKGDFEDHALLLANLLLGLGLDAYVCVGRLRRNKHGRHNKLDKRHVWVMTRHADGDPDPSDPTRRLGSVQMWETCTGRPLRVPNCWHPKKERRADDAAQAGTASSAAAADGARPGRAARGKSVRIAEEGMAAQQQRELAHDAKMGSGADGTGGELVSADGARSAGESSGGAADNQLLEGMNEMRSSLNLDELLSRNDIEASMEEVTFLDEEELYEGGAGHERLTEAKGSGARALVVANDASVEATAARHDALAAGARGDAAAALRQRVVLPYASLECLFNHKNLWISTDDSLPTVLDPAELWYDLVEHDADDDLSSAANVECRWKRYVTKRMENADLPQPFYTPRPLAPRVPENRLRNMEHQIAEEIKTQLRYVRSKRGSVKINVTKDLEAALCRGLEMQEKQKNGDESAKGERSGWEREVKTKLPIGATLKARAFSYSYHDAKRIRKHLLSQCDYANETKDGIEYVLAVKAFRYYGGICSVWVYFGLIDKARDEKSAHATTTRA